MIEVVNLAKHYDGVQAVKSLSFRVERGEIFGFIGPNGAGKATTIRIMATLLDPSAGTIKVDGRSVVSEPEEVRRVIGFMPDNFGVYDRITVWEYLDFFAAAYGIERRTRRAALEAIMELTDLKGLRDRPTGELSKGMRQRLCVAKTLVHDPKVLILDEPANGLDPRARIEFRALLKELSAMGKTVFISSHILNELSDVCTGVAILEKGRLVASGTIAEIQQRLQPHALYRLEVATDAAGARAALLELPGVSDVKEEGGALSFAFDGDKVKVAELVKALVTRGVGVTGLSEEKTDLEDLFMKLTRGEVA